LICAKKAQDAVLWFLVFQKSLCLTSFAKVLLHPWL
jgi:hypothetical protein